MGNKCLTCSGGKNSNGSESPSCFASSKKSRQRRKRQAGNVLPSDLHASGGHSVVSTHSHSVRPDTLELQTARNSESGGSRFPDFSLHGVQKMSPIAVSATATPPGTNTTIEDVDLQKIEKLFQVYCDDVNKKIILPDGVERFCLDLEVDPTEFIVLALAWKFKAATMCQFTKKEFVSGFLTLHCDSIHSLKSSFKKLESDALSNFKDLYRFTFQFALDIEEGQRSLPCDIAIAMWDVVFSRSHPLMLESWIKYLNEHNVRGISRDTWNMFLYLTESLNDDLSNYNDNEAWPSLFDDFVEYKRAEIEKNNPETEEKENDSQDDEANVEGSRETEDNDDHRTSVVTEREKETLDVSTCEHLIEESNNTEHIVEHPGPDKTQQTVCDADENDTLKNTKLPGHISSSSESSPGPVCSASENPALSEYAEKPSPPLLLSQLHSDPEDSSNVD
ncbi:DCN1-like protein 3 isoform X2 [Clavelina lepadiformis]|uniref:Defective in cullin neddylation protein n=1 Tax=Clavelina lepadiformis TaxID=159417 RepID=A0ABP0GCQ6_CLALP